MTGSLKRYVSSFTFLPFVVLALVIGAYFRHPLVTDDPYITYRYARNLIEGNGFVYNPGQHVLSTTTPLYTLVLAALGLILRDIPALGFWLSVLSYGICAWWLYLIASGYKMRIAGVLAGLFTLLSPGLIATFGLETGLDLALAFAAIHFYLRDRPSLTFALLALLTLTRNDGVVLAAILGTRLLLTNHAIRTRPQQVLRPFLIYVLMLLPWLLFAGWWFGSPFPFTLTAKIVQAQSGNWDPFAVGLIKWAREWLGVLLPLGLLAFVGLAWALRARSRLLLVALWPVLHLAAYTLLGVAFYAWYIAPLLPVLALFAGIGVQQVSQWMGLHISHVTRVAQVASGILIVLAGVVIAGVELRADLESGMQRSSPKVEVYRRAADWLAVNTSPLATVDALEVGVIGYYDARRTLDFVGLVDPRRIPYLRYLALADGVRRASADYVIAIPSDEWLPVDPWFSATYRPVREIRAPDFYNGKPLVIYRRVDEGQPAAESRAVNLSFDRRVNLISVDLMSHSVCRGETLPLALHLRAREALSQDYKFTLQLVGAENRVIAQSDTFYPLRLPEDGAPFVDYQGLPIPRGAPPGSYDLIFAMYVAPRGDRLSLTDANGNDAGDFVSLGKVQVC